MPLLLAFLYQYIYSTIYWDKEFASGKNYYLSANSIYELKKEFPDCFEGISVMYYMNEKYGAQYIVQFLVSNIKVISAAPGSDIKEALVLSARILTEDDINLQDYKIIMKQNYTLKKCVIKYILKKLKGNIMRKVKNLITGAGILTSSAMSASTLPCMSFSLPGIADVSGNTGIASTWKILSCRRSKVVTGR